MKTNYVCYADDDDDDHEIFSTALREILPDVKLDIFDSGKSLLSFLKNPDNPVPDIIFLDFNMPGEDGNDCLKYVRATHRMLHVPLVVYSTSKSSQLVRICHENGATKCIVKPNTINEVRALLAQTIHEIENRM
jgi:CheY-like chemotaxis protein